MKIETNGVDIVPYEEQVIEGGEVADVSNDYQIDPIKKHKLTTASNLAYVLVGVLVISILGHYITSAWLSIAGHAAALEAIQDVFKSSFSLVSILVTSAVTYFLAKEK